MVIDLESRSHDDNLREIDNAYLTLYSIRSGKANDSVIPAIA
jgi:hypothetical protein